MSGTGSALVSYPPPGLEGLKAVSVWEGIACGGTALDLSGAVMALWGESKLDSRCDGEVGVGLSDGSRSSSAFSVLEIRQQTRCEGVPPSS